MPAKKITSNQDETVIEIRISHSNSMLTGEEAIQEALNEAGQIASKALLTRFDTDGSPITVGTVKLTSKGLFPKRYQTPHGQIEISRHVYQGTKGGSTYCPLDSNARTIHSATPKLAKQISHKYSKLSVDEVNESFLAVTFKPFPMRLVALQWPKKSSGSTARPCKRRLSVA